MVDSACRAGGVPESGPARSATTRGFCTDRLAEARDADGAFYPLPE
jgi:hypothetical protein